jgi:hypothetical protein
MLLSSPSIFCKVLDKNKPPAGCCPSKTHAGRELATSPRLETTLGMLDFNEEERESTKES